jgi:O-antigen ligase
MAPASATQAEIKFFEAAGHATIGIDEVTVKSGDFIAEPLPPKGRPATLQQMLDNLLSIFGPSSDGGLEGSKQFRLAWWGKIVDYTVFGEYFWTGKGFGINLADADGFQSTLDHSLRSPHNSEMTVLARMGVPGLLLWILVQGAFGIGLLRAILAYRRAGDARFAAIGALLFVYWIVMLVDTSFDPYLEGPQGGIWFWAVFGLGLVVMRIAPRRVPA